MSSDVSLRTLPRDRRDNWRQRFLAAHAELCEFAGAPKGFLVFSNSGKIHLIGVTPSLSKFGHRASTSPQAADWAANELQRHEEQSWIILHWSPAARRFYYPSRTGLKVAQFELPPAAPAG
mmetsp:Transcript_53995/g.99758  ORF Transcript_53995/g.99758 Transcript_53995/m.99758 type:complete len:121 (+) Transcript_53995:95-457(+)